MFNFSVKINLAIKQKQENKNKKPAEQMVD